MICRNTLKCYVISVYDKEKILEVLENSSKIDSHGADWEAAVIDFHRKYGFPVAGRWTAELSLQRVHLITEEVAELVEALHKMDEETTLDALADLLYVVVGTGVALGLPVTEAFQEVHRSNMTKIAKQDRLSHPGKGEGYLPPDLKTILGRSGR